MGSWLSSIDPTAVVVALSGLVGLFGIGKHKEAAEQLGSIRVIVAELVERFLGDRLRFARLPTDDDAGRLEAWTWEQLTQKGIKRTSARSLIVHELVARGLVEWTRRLNERAASKLPGQVAELAQAAEQVTDAFARHEPDKPIDTIAEARAAGVELLAIGEDGKLGPASSR